MTRPHPKPVVGPRFEVYKDAKSEWRWRLVARNGRIVADSGEGYASKSNCERARWRIAGYALAAALNAVPRTDSGVLVWGKGKSKK